jgi:hypothetical protein
VALQAPPAQAATGPGVDDFFHVNRDSHNNVIDLLANDNANGQRFAEDNNGQATAAHGTITPNFGSGKSAPTYTPDAGFSGIDTVNYTADIQGGGTDTATATLVVGNETCMNSDAEPGHTVNVLTYNSATDTQTATIPAGAGDVTVIMCGASGADFFGSSNNGLGGRGGYTEGTLNNGATLTTALDLSIVLGQQGDDSVAGQQAVGGGGAPAAAGHGGGGATLLYATSDLVTPLMVAGGGGGAGEPANDCVDGNHGGVGGGLEGGDGLAYHPYTGTGPPGGLGANCDPPPGGPYSTSAPVGEGATQSAGGASPVVGGEGSFKQGGNATGAAGAGGGGWYGGGAGSPATGGGDKAAPGGGGSGHVTTSGPVPVSGRTLGNGHSGNGAVRLSYLTPTPPAFISPPISGAATVGINYSRAVTTSGQPPAAITFSSLPPGLHYVDHGDGTATISGAPTTPGSYDFTATADNGQPPPATQAEHLDVVPLPPPSSPGPSASSSASASPTGSPSATASPTSSSSPSGRRSLTLTTGRADIQPTQAAPLTASGQAGQAIELRCYSRPSTTYRTVRTATIDAAGDPITFQITPGTNTRCFVQYAANPTSGASPSVVISVHTTLSLSAVRTAPRTYRFQGRNLPRRAGQLITIYRIDANGNEIRTANAQTDSSGTYYVPALGSPGRTFTGTGTFFFVARTSSTLNNAAGQSAQYQLTIR